MKRMYIEVNVDITKCNACGLCAEICPQDVFTFYTVDERELKKAPAGFLAYPSREALCIGCGWCEKKCPKKAIEIKIIPKKSNDSDLVDNLIDREISAL